MPALTASLDDQHEVCVLTLTGELDMASAGRFRSVGDEAVAANRDVIVDLAECRFIDSTGIGWVVRTAEQVQRSGRRLVLVAPNSQVRQVFELTRVTDHVPTHNSMEAALQSLAA